MYFLDYFVVVDDGLTFLQEIVKQLEGILKFWNFFILPKMLVN